MPVVVVVLKVEALFVCGGLLVLLAFHTFPRIEDLHQYLHHLWVDLKVGFCPFCACKLWKPVSMLPMSGGRKTRLNTSMPPTSAFPHTSTSLSFFLTLFYHLRRHHLSSPQHRRHTVGSLVFCHHHEPLWGPHEIVRKDGFDSGFCAIFSYY